MTTRRIAAALLAAVLSVGTVAATSGPAEAKDTTWPGTFSAVN